MTNLVLGAGAWLVGGMFPWPFGGTRLYSQRGWREALIFFPKNTTK